MTFTRIADQAARFFVGGLFIFSGLIKLNDPIGTAIKMEEYFSVFAADFGSFFGLFVPYALEIGMIMIILEIVLGVAVLIFWRMNLTAWLLLLLMVFFTFLTFYSAYFNKVTDCGCFGDAIKLTPWESFFKDVILMFPVLHLFWHRKRYTPVLRTREGYAVVGIATALSLFVGVYAIRHLPFIDFRAYAIGKHIPTQMQAQVAPHFEYVFTRKDNGEKVRSESWLGDTTLYKYEAYVQTNENDDRTVPKITDYAVSTVDGEDITQLTFEGPRLLFIIYDVNRASASNMDAVRKLAQELEGKVELMVFTASTPVHFEAFRHEHQLAVPYFFVDATVLKTMVRSNPGIMLWVDGTVKGKWHHNDTPDAAEVLSLIQG
jgi:uncharacterized membrane protein YphA (DoxX/SURF4 family)